MNGPTWLPIDRLEPSMVLAEAVAERDGPVLLSRGSVLGDAVLAELRRRGIPGAAILPREAAGLAREAGAEREAQRARIDFLFRHVAGASGPTRPHRAVMAFRLGEWA